MALSTLESTTINRAISATRKALEELKPVLDGLKIVYDSVGGVKATITQANLDLAIGLSGITKQQVDDALFVLTGSLLTSLTTSYAQLQQLAARG